MVTRLYLHSVNTAVTGTLPTTNQSGLTATYSGDSVATSKRSMTTTIGTSQTSITASGQPTFGQFANYWIARFISNPLDTGSTSISANTWTINFSGSYTNTVSDTAPINQTTSPGPIRITAYVWRPSTGAKIGNILDGNSVNFNKWTAASSQRSAATTFAGAAVTGAIGDVIILELWVHIRNASNSAGIGTIVYYDGTTVTATTNTVVSNHAAFLETPQNLTFSTPAPSSIDMTPNSTTLTNKIITIV